MFHGCKKYLLITAQYVFVQQSFGFTISYNIYAIKATALRIFLNAISENWKWKQNDGMREGGRDERVCVCVCVGVCMQKNSNAQKDVFASASSNNVLTSGSKLHFQ